MKFAIPLLAVGMVAGPAFGEVRQATIEHNGQTLAVTYQAAVETNLRQVNIGPRSNMVCRWTSAVTVHRTAADAEGRTIPALRREIAGTSRRSGERLGPCGGVSEQVKLDFAGGKERLQSQVAQVAREDAQQLRAELTSLARLSGSEHPVR